MSLRKTSFRRTEKEKNFANQFKTVFVHLLDNNQKPLEIELKDGMNGTDLLEEVCLLLGGVLERDYFGLRYVYRDNIKRWLDGSQCVYHQVKKANTATLSFRVKHYPNNPVVDVMQDIARYFIYLQLRRDLFSGNLLVKGELLAKLISLAIQAEHGDVMDPTIEEILMLVTNLSIVENVNSRTIEEVSRVVVTLNGLDNKEAETDFLRIVSKLESYGVEPYAVTISTCLLLKRTQVQIEYQTGEKLFLTMNHQGICTFSGEKRKDIFYWENISKMMFVKKSFLVDINIDNKWRHKFKFVSEDLAKEFWKWASDRQYFMTLNNSTEAKTVRSNNRILSRKITHKFSGRSLKELTISCQTLNDIPQPPRIRSDNSAIIRSNSTKAICRHSVVIEDSETTQNMYATIPRRSKVNKDISMSPIDLEDNNDQTVSEPSATSEESMLISSRHIDSECVESELTVIAEDKIVEEAIESCESKIVTSLFSNIDQLEEYGDDDHNQIRERQCDHDQDCKVTKLGNGQMTEHCDLDANTVDDVYRLQNVDGLFFAKFVVLTTLILLVIMITSLVAYYYYRSSTIADLNKQKYSSEWNKNIDLESIKRFVLRNDAP